MLRSWLVAGVAAALMSSVKPAIALSPAPSEKKGTFSFTATVQAERNLPKNDALAFSNYKADRKATITCNMLSNPAGGVGPEGMTAEQKAAEQDMKDAGARAEADANASGAVQDAAALQREVAACGNDQACQMRVAMKMMNDPRLQNAQQGAIEANQTMSAPSGRLEAMVTKPVWQRWFQDPDFRSCTGKITFNDFEKFDRGFVAAGQGTSPGTRTVTGTKDASGVHPELWFNFEKNQRQFTIPIGTYEGEAVIEDTYSGNSVETMSLVSGMGQMPTRLLTIGPEGAPSMAATGSKVFVIESMPETGGWRGTITISWNFKP